MTDFLGANCLGSCNPPQILNLNYAISDMSSLTDVATSGLQLLASSKESGLIKDATNLQKGDDLYKHILVFFLK